MFIIMKHYYLSFFIATLMSMAYTMASAYDIAVANSNGKTIYYSYNSDGSSVSINSGYSEYTGTVVIPETVTYNGKTYSVTSIGSDAFEYCSGLTSVTIPNSVTSIGAEAFYNCSGLTSVTIPNSVTSIGSSAFYKCSGLKKVIVPNIDLKNWCSITFANSSANPLDYAHHLYSDENTEITKLVIPDGVTSIGEWAFQGCSGLTSVTIPNSVTCIGSEAFYNTSIKSLTIGTNIQTMESKALRGIDKVIWLSNTPPSGYKNAEGTINYVPNNSYSGLSGQKIYPFLSSMFEVDGIKYVPVSPSERTCDAIDCVYNESAKNTKIGNTVTYKNVTMTVKNVGNDICSGNTYIKTLEYNFDGPIGSYAFSGCSGLTSVTIPNSVTSIGYSAFSGCSGLTSVTIPNSVTSIGEWAFNGCSGLTSVTIPNSVTSIGGWAFNGCSGLTSVTIPNSVTGIGSYAFGDCSGLTSVTIGSSVTSVTIGSSVTSIGSCAFYRCSGLTSVAIGNSVTRIGSTIFSGCSSLTSVRFENSKDNTPIVLKDNEVFSDCPLDEVYIGRKLSYTTTSSAGYSPFYRNTTLRSVKFTDKETEISDYEFYGCTNLTDVSMGDGVKSIGAYAFSGCSSLEQFTCGRQLESIGKEAFSDCTSMTKFRTRAAVPPTCGAQALDDINKWECTLYVPTESIDDYQAADQWKNFFFIEKFNLQGDSNGDDVVNAKDYSGVANYIMDDSPEEFDLEASDVDENGTVDVRDYVGIANIIATGSIYGGTSNNAKAAMSKGMAMPATDESDAENVIYVENVSGSKNSQVELSVRMRNASDIRGFQFDLYLPEGVTMANNAKASLSSDRLAAGDAHTLMADEMTDGAVRFLCSSMNDESFAGGDGEIATLTVNIADNVANGDYDVVVKNAIMTETDISRSYEADDIKSTLTVLDQTGVETVTADDERRDGSIYTVGGQLVGKKSTTSQLRKGIYIRNGKKIVVK